MPQREALCFFEAYHVPASFVLAPSLFLRRFSYQLSESESEVSLEMQSFLSLRWFLCLLFLFLWSLRPSFLGAHELPTTRVIHMLLHDDTLEIYVNLLLPSSPKSRVWIALFDQDRDGRLNPQEQRRLGLFLSSKLLAGLRLSVNQKDINPSLNEMENSRVRGQPLQRRYAWDYRFKASPLFLQEGINRLVFHLPLLYPSEEIPIALLVRGAFLLRDQKSRVRQHAGLPVSLCRIQLRGGDCVFLIEKQGSAQDKNMQGKRKKKGT